MPNRCCRCACWVCVGSGGTALPTAVWFATEVELMPAPATVIGTRVFQRNGNFPRQTGAGLDRHSGRVDRGARGSLELGLVHPDRSVACLGRAGAEGDDRAPA